MATLVVIRHAKAEPYAATDHDRDLADRGRRDAAELGAWLASEELAPDHAFVSSARRTLATWDHLTRGARSQLQPDVRDELYSATPEAALEVLQQTPEEAEVVAVVGHNPTMAYLVHLLDDGQADPVAFRAISEGYPTAAATVLQVTVPWSELAFHGATITGFHVGHGSRAV